MRWRGRDGGGDGRAWRLRSLASTVMSYGDWLHCEAWVMEGFWKIDGLWRNWICKWRWCLELRSLLNTHSAI